MNKYSDRSNSAGRHSYSISAASAQQITFRKILSVVSTESGVGESALLHKSRSKAHIAQCRQLAMYLMHVVARQTMTQVGLFFGRDRTTVAHACGRIEDQRERGEFDQMVLRLEAVIGQILSTPAKQFLTRIKSVV